MGFFGRTQVSYLAGSLYEACFDYVGLGRAVRSRRAASAIQLLRKCAVRVIRSQPRILSKDRISLNVASTNLEKKWKPSATYATRHIICSLSEVECSVAIASLIYFLGHANNQAITSRKTPSS
jgi:hypothetical protein